MKKLYARVAPLDYLDTSIYFDFAEEAKNGYVTLISGERNGTDYKSPEWEKLEKIMNDLSDELWDFENPGKAYFTEPAKSATEIFRYYLPNFKYSPRLVHRWKEAVHAWNEHGMEDETACELLELYTGKKWDFAGIHGSCQGDFATVYFPHIEDGTKRKEWIDELSAYYFGSGVEVEIHDEETKPEEADDVSGFRDYIPIPYATENEIKEYLAENFGDEETKPDNVTLFIPEEAHTVTTYSYRTA